MTSGIDPTNILTEETRQKSAKLTRASVAAEARALSLSLTHTLSLSFAFTLEICFLTVSEKCFGGSARDDKCEILSQVMVFRKQNYQDRRR